MILASNLSSRVKSLIFILLIVYVAFLQLNFPAILHDPFHFGELFASYARVIQGDSAIVIHGARNYVLAIFVQSFWGNTHYVALAVAVSQVLDALAVIIFSLLIISVGKEKHFLYVAISIIVGSFLVGQRDIFLLLLLWRFLNPYFYLRLSKTLDFLITAVIVVIGMLWSFDRGLACLLLGSLGILFKHRTILSLFFPIVVLGCLFLVSATTPIDYFSNLIFLFQTAHQWSYGFQNKAMILTAAACMINLFGIYLLARSTVFLKRDLDNIFLFVFLSLLSLLMLKIGINRADEGHVRSTIWVPLLMMYFIQGRFIFKAISILLIATFFAYVQKDINFQNFYSLHAKQKFLSVFVNPPENASMVSKEIKLISAMISQSKPDCLIDMTNSGLFNALTFLPSCSSITYPVYATEKYEQLLISDFSKSNPPVIVYSSSNIFYAIDGKPMNKRLPALDAFLIQNYPHQTCFDTYCLRYKESPQIDR